MNNQRAVYQPLVETVQRYDLPDEEIEEERSRLPLLIVIALIVLAAFAGVVWLAYNQGVARGQAGAPVVVAAPDGPVRVAPTDAGGEPTPYLGLKVYSDPLPPDQEAETSSLAQSAEPLDIAPPATTEAPPARLAAPVTPPAAAPTPTPAAAAPQVAAAAPAAPRPLAAPPAPAPIAATPAPARVQAPSAVVAAPGPPPAAAPASAGPTSIATTGAAVLQIGAFESEDIANNAWRTFQARYGAVAGSLVPDIQRADLGARGVWFRLRAGPFADRASAVDACEKLKAAGGSCFIAAP